MALLILGVLVFAIVRYGDERAGRAVIESLEKEERQAAVGMSQAVQQTLYTVTASLQYLVLLIERNLSESKPIDGVAQTLLDFSRTHPVFTQLRYLDLDGMEIVRVDAANNGARIVPPQELQSKASREYFQRAVDLPPGKVMVFPLDFNRERGALETPLNPVIRIAKTVFDDTGSKVGVAIINYKARALLGRLFDQGKIARGNPNIVSLRGRWLMESNGFRPTEYTINAVEDRNFSERLADEWQRMGEKTDGVFRTANGMFSYRVLLPSALGESPSVRPVSWTVPKGGSGEEGGWIVMSHVPASQLASILASHQFLSRPAKILLAALISIVAWFLALQVSDSRVRLRELKSSATSDDLTGLVNRGEFDRTLQRTVSWAQRHERSMGVVYIDVNEFKALNDTHGHASGDRVLVAIGQRLVASCRSSDVAARLGGDEFAIILSEVSGRPDTRMISMNIAARMQKPLQLDHGEYQIRVSIGVAIFPDDGETPETLLAYADEKMYTDKAISKRTASAA